MDASKSHDKCNNCGGPGGTHPWLYCQACLDKHAEGELPLGMCKGCRLYVKDNNEVEERISE